MMRFSFYLRHKTLLAMLTIIIPAVLVAQHKPPVERKRDPDNVRFAEGSRVNRHDQEVVRIYIDHFGDLYPRGTIPMSAGALQECDNSLFRYYDRDNGCGTSKERLALLSLYKVTEKENWPGTWDEVQDSIASEAAAAARARSEQVSTPLTVLVHGFNNTDSEITDVFDSVAARIRGVGLSRAILAVYWDGVHTDHPLLPAGPTQLRFQRIWGQGQQNTYFAGLGLRRVLNRLPSTIKLRIITHSSGGNVATNALWNVETKLENKPWNREYTRQLTEYREERDDSMRFRTPRQHDTRLGMFAPAMPGLTFADFANRTPAETMIEEPKRIVIGQDRNDEVLLKYINVPQSHGATTLGVWTDEFTRYLQPLNKTTPDRAYCVDFAKRSSSAREKHAWLAYLHRPAADVFLRLLTEDSPRPNELTCSEMMDK